MPNVALAVSLQLSSGETVNVWSRVGLSVAPNRGDSFTGLGSFGMISTIEEGGGDGGVFARGIAVTLSGFNAALISDVLNNYTHGMPVAVYLIINGQFIPAWAGRTDQRRLAVNGQTASLSIASENRSVEMNTSATQFRYTAECQNIFYPNGRAFDAVTAIAAQSQLCWGRIPNR